MRPWSRRFPLHLLVKVLVLVAIGSQFASAQEPAPYAASVIVDEAALRCGPGEAYYVVAMLERGANVEVHKNVRGWCAIRPPEGCFSWVPARQLRVDAAGKLGQVIDPKAVALIGSNLARPSKHLYQVELAVGESVAIIGEKRFVRQAEGTSETWYKISPPAGEFRWIETRFLSKPVLSPPESIAQAKSADDAEAKPASALSEEESLSPAEPARESTQESAKEPAPLPSTTTRTPAPIGGPREPNKSSAKGKGFRDVTPGRETFSSSPSAANEGAEPSTIPNQRVTFLDPVDQGNAHTLELRNPTAPSAAYAAPPISPTSVSSAGNGDFYDQLGALEAELALAVAKPPRDWSLITLHRRAQQLAQSGPSALERGRAKMVMDRIELYEAHQKQSLELEVQRAATATVSAPPPKPTLTNATPPSELHTLEVRPEAPWKPADLDGDANTDAERAAPSGNAPPEPAPNPNWFDKMKGVVGTGLKSAPAPTTPTHFDAQGKLQEVRSDNAEVKYPPYALLDDEGKIVAFLGSPVLKLDKYVGKRIGVYGRRGLHSASQTTYVEAVELVDLEVASQPRKPLRTTFGMTK